jgi:hypothetical protein
MRDAMTRKELMDLAARQTKQETNVKAAGATCPMPGCGALAIAYEAADSVKASRGHSAFSWDFVCSECGTEFAAPTGDLVFQSIPRDWLFAQVCRA